MNKETGLKCNHLIKTYKLGYAKVYTDRQHANEIITNVPGVSEVFSEQFMTSEHLVYFDPRYAREIVVQNIQDALEPVSLQDILQDYLSLHPLFR